MKAILTRLEYGIIAISGTKLDEAVLEELDELERLSALGELIDDKEALVERQEANKKEGK